MRPINPSRLRQSELWIDRDGNVEPVAEMTAARAERLLNWLRARAERYQEGMLIMLDAQHDDERAGDAADMVEALTAQEWIDEQPLIVALTDRITAAA